MALLPKFDGVAPRRPSLPVDEDTGAARAANARADALHSVARSAGQLTDRLLGMAARARRREAVQDASAAAIAVTMPGVEFAFSGPQLPAGPAAKSPAGGARAASEIQASSDLPLSFLKAIDHSEGAGDYDTLFGHAQRAGGRFAGTRVSQMTVGQAIAFADPNGAYAQSVKSQIGRVATPMGRHQIVGTTLRRTAAHMRIDPDQPFDAGTQNRMAAHLARQRLAGASTMSGKIAALRSEWEGLRSVPRAQMEQIVRDFESGTGSAVSSGPRWETTPVGSVSVELTGAAGPAPHAAAGTIYGDAYNDAAASIYTNRLEAGMRAQMDALALEYEADPQGLADALEALRGGYLDDQPAEIAASLTLSFEREKQGLVVAAGRQQFNQVEAEHLASFDEIYQGRLNSAARLAASAGDGDEATRSRTEAALLAELEGIERTIDGAPLSPLEKGRRKREVRSNVFSARVLSGFEALDDPADRAEYVHAFQTAWKSGEGEAGEIDAADYERINGELLRRAKADETERNRRAAQIDKSIEAQIGFLKKGYPVTPAVRDEIAASVAATNDPALVDRLTFLDRLSSWQRAHVAERPEVIDMQLDLLNRRIAAEGANDKALVTQTVMEELRDNMIKGLAADPLDWADRAGVADIAPVDFTDEATASASLAQRAADARAVADHYGIRPRFFTVPEVDALKKAMEETPTELPRLAASISAGLGADAPRAFAEISKDAPVLAQIGGLVHATGDQRLAVEAAEGLQMRRLDSYKSALPPAGKLQSAAIETLAGSLGGNVGAMAQVVETAAAVFERRAARRGIATDDFSEAGSPARELFIQTINETLGARTIGDVVYGGLTEVNGFATIAPPDLQADQLDGMLNSISDDDLLFQQAIGTANGLPIRLTQIRSGRLVRVADGRYRIATGSIEDGDPRFVPTLDGGIFELDVRMLARTQLQRGLDDWTGMPIGRVE